MAVAERATVCDGLSCLSAKIFYHFTRFFHFIIMRRFTPGFR
ncbi:hypothetical protein [Pectobacterium brasiliense]